MTENDGKIISLLSFLGRDDINFGRIIWRCSGLIIVVAVTVILCIWFLFLQIEQFSSVKNATEITIGLNQIQLKKQGELEVSDSLIFVFPYRLITDTGLIAKNETILKIAAEGQVCTGHAMDWGNKYFFDDKEKERGDLLRRYTLASINDQNVPKDPTTFMGISRAFYQDVLRKTMMLEWRDPNGIFISGMKEENIDNTNKDLFAWHKILPCRNYGELIGVFAFDENDVETLLEITIREYESKKLKDKTCHSMLAESKKHFFPIGRYTTISIKHDKATVSNSYNLLETQPELLKYYSGSMEISNVGQKKLFLLVNDVILSQNLVEELYKSDTLPAFHSYYEILNELWRNGPLIRTDKTDPISNMYHLNSAGDYQKWRHFRKSLFFQNNFGLFTVKISAEAI